jgi:hypothetical protein
MLEEASQPMVARQWPMVVSPRCLSPLVAHDPVAELAAAYTPAPGWDSATPPSLDECMAVWASRSWMVTTPPNDRH